MWPITTRSGACRCGTGARCGRRWCWITILRKREGFRAAFAGFDPAVVAGWGEDQVARLLADPGIVRHRGKVEGAIKSARAFLEVEAREGFSDCVWKHVGGRAVQNAPRSMAQVPAETDVSRALSKQLRKDGFSFCGPTTVYAFMQAAGLVNDHLLGCPARERVASLSVA